jgi:acyl carrier protein
MKILARAAWHKSGTGFSGQEVIIVGIAAKLSFEEFRKLLAQRLGMPEEKFAPKASFLDDLAIDSIRMVELILEFERMGIKIPPESVWDIQTVGDAYNFYLKYA